MHAAGATTCRRRYEACRVGAVAARWTIPTKDAQRHGDIQRQRYEEKKCDWHHKQRIDVWRPKPAVGTPLDRIFFIVKEVEERGRIQGCILMRVVGLSNEASDG